MTAPAPRWIPLPDAPRARALATLEGMAMLCQGARRDPVMVQLAREVALWNAGPRDTRGQAAAILRHVQSEVAYILDPVDQEVLAPPRYVLETGAGDCDEMAGAVAALASCVGIPSRLCAVTFRIMDPEWRHVYAELYTGNAWEPADATVARAPLGWAPRGFRHLRVAT